ncbi:WD40-repeat-containing domain protein, partial [Ochromonadaceae sp. CCMP2298]
TQMDVATLTGHRGAVLAVTGQGNVLVTAGHDKKIIVWDAVTASRGDVSFNVRGFVVCMVPCIVSGSWDQTAKVWGLATGSLVTTFTGHGSRVRVVRVLNR